ncbi:hypothetical protein FHN49_15545 [Escherichia coli]|nr:hypothetical protein [Salmonella enterica]ECW6808586.1 hypothetical protein [Salmonella enterica subsp. enterica serovar Enteritidis]EFB2638166.1 hypothetical protein [Escherichia coli]EFW2783884.1 hypothetical protein [Shigella sonnei]EFW2788060.1 hypothetical protein [Shigella sonnei]
MTENDRFRTPLTASVQNLVKLVLDMLYNSYIHFVQKISLYLEFLPIVGSPHWNRRPKINVGKSKARVLTSDHNE